MTPVKMEMRVPGLVWGSVGMEAGLGANQLSAQIAFENYRARLNRVFDVGSDEIYKPATDVKSGDARV